MKKIFTTLIALLFVMISFTFAANAASQTKQSVFDNTPAITQMVAPSMPPLRVYEAYPASMSPLNIRTKQKLPKKYGLRKSSAGFKTKIFYPPENIGRF